MSTSAAVTVSQRRMADAAVAAAHEQHAQIRDSAEHHGVMPGAARQMIRPDAGALDGGGELRLHVGRTRHRRAALDLLDLGRDVAAPADLGDLGEHVGDRGVARGVVAGTDVERQFAPARNDVDRAVRHGQAADSADQRGRGRAALLDIKHDLGSSSSSITAHRHRHRAGVAGDAVDRDAVADGPGDRGDDADRQVLLQQHRPLLDMHLEIAQHLLGPPRQRTEIVGVEAGLVDHIGDALAVCVPPHQHGGVEASDHGARADIVRGEAHALLFGKADHVEMERQAPAAAVELFDHHEAGEDAEPAVVVSAIDHGVVVRADDQRLGGRVGGGVAADDVADAIDPRRHAGVRHPVAQLRGGRAVRRREIGAGQAVGRLGELRQPRRQRR